MKPLSSSSSTKRGSKKRDGSAPRAAGLDVRRWREDAGVDGAGLERGEDLGLAARLHERHVVARPQAQALDPLARGEIRTAAHACDAEATPPHRGGVREVGPGVDR